MCFKVEVTKLVKKVNINNRRYLGNKYKLLGFIKTIVDEGCSDIKSVFDVFSGTGAVASAFQDKQIVTNDIMYSNYICNLAWFSPQKYSKKKLERIIDGYNDLEVNEENYMTENFSNTYFSHDDCSKIGFIREDIDRLFINQEINERERAILITSLIYAMDKIAKTCGHYDAYRKGVEFDEHLELCLPSAKQNNNKNNKCFNMDSNELAKKVSADLAYIDPPYNSRQYSDAYHLLENIAKWDKPEVFGVAKKMDRSGLKSKYCTREATEAFEDLIENLNCKYIVLSYNNMANKGNDRSNAKISDEDILRILNKKGTVQVFSEEYRAFTTGKSDIENNQERLFLCICHNKSQTVQSPLNYTGGKYKLLPQILPLFPQKINNFVDLFCGGGNVGINVFAKSYKYNDNCEPLIGLLQTIKKRTVPELLEKIENLIEKYELSDTKKHSYEFYNCDSSTGLGSYNRNGYLRLRSDFNRIQNKNDEYYIMLYVLIVYAFNNQIRFNSKGEFNLPPGKRDFNQKMKDKFVDFAERLHSQDAEFLCLDFTNYPIDDLTEGDFVYADPPYLIMCATYNEQGGWTKDDELSLLAFLDKLDSKKVKFALSNVIESKGLTNELLKEWVDKRPNYSMIDLDYSYSNANYQRKDKNEKAREVLIVNY